MPTLTDKIQTGDWVRFYRNGDLVIGIVAYVSKPKSGFLCFEVHTDKGSISNDNILEVRRGSNQETN